MIEDFLNKFRSRLPALLEKEREWESVMAPNFNVFRVLRVQRSEVKLHSRFLASLLDPCGTHSQGDRFLRDFLEVAAEAGLHRPTRETRSDEWKIKTEEVTPEFGRLDIVLRARPFIAAIENKVDAGEQPDQLSRYAEWLKTQKREFHERNLIFLTPTGRQPVSIPPRLQDCCICLSYREHVREWLTQSLKNVRAPSLRNCIEQYLETVNRL